jgi:hypothetical protein
MIRIKSAEQFKKLLEELSNDLVTANFHMQMLKSLDSAAGEYAAEMNESTAFWRLTMDAHRDTLHFRLCRAYDPFSGVLSLPNLLETIKKNLNIFDTENFRERLKDNPFVESLAEHPRVPDAAQLDADLEYVREETNPAVEKLVKWRHNFFGHRSAQPILGTPLMVSHALSGPEIEELANRGIEILNRYGYLFQAQTFSTNLIGGDDYMALLRAMRERLQRIDREVEEMLRKAKETEMSHGS